MIQYINLEGTAYFPFGANDTSGSGGDGASPAYHVRECGAASDAAPVYSGTPTLLSEATYPAGCYEIAVPATAANGFAASKTYAVFCTLLIDSQNPTGFVGMFSTASALNTLTLQAIRDAMKLAPTAGDPAAGSVDKALDNIEEHTGTTLLEAIQAGALSWTSTEKNQALAALGVTGDPDVPSALIWKIARIDGKIKARNTIAKHPDEELVVEADFTDVLGDDDAIVDAESGGIIEISLASGAGDTPLDSTAFDDVDNAEIVLASKVKFTITDGTDGVDYKVKVGVLTEGGDKIYVECPVSVNEN